MTNPPSPTARAVGTDEPMPDEQYDSQTEFAALEEQRSEAALKTENEKLRAEVLRISAALEDARTSRDTQIREAVEAKLAARLAEDRTANMEHKLQSALGEKDKLVEQLREASNALSVKTQELKCLEAELQERFDAEQERDDSLATDTHQNIGEPRDQNLVYQLMVQTSEVKTLAKRLQRSDKENGELRAEITSLSEKVSRLDTTVKEVQSSLDSLEDAEQIFLRQLLSLGYGPPRDLSPEIILDRKQVFEEVQAGTVGLIAFAKELQSFIRDLEAHDIKATEERGRYARAYNRLAARTGEPSV